MKTEQIRLTPTLRVESGPARKTAIAHATIDGKDAMLAELDKDGKADPNKQTRDSYVLVDGAPYRIKSHYKIGLRDALGKAIVEGEEFTYLDHYGPFVWYYYRLEDVPLDDALLTTMAGKLGKAPDTLTHEDIAGWFGLTAPTWVTQPKGKWNMKRFATKGVCVKRDEALSASAALKE